MSTDHVDAIAAAGAGDRSRFGYTQVPDGRAEAAEYVNWLLDDAAHDRAAPFVQRRVSDGRVVGCTRFLNPLWPLGRTASRRSGDRRHLAVGLGAAHAINTEAKLLLLTHAFETWEVQRVAICTDARNAQSRQAIERIGARFEGELRRHRRSTRAGEAVGCATPQRMRSRSTIGPPCARRSANGSGRDCDRENTRDAHRSVVTSAPVPLSHSSVKLSQAVTVGLAAGLLGGLFGVGGGLIIVPGLVSLAGMDRRLAHGTSLAATLPIAAASLITYVSHGNVDWPVALFLAVGAIAGAIIGTTLLQIIPKNVLIIIFVITVLATATRLAISTDSTGRGDLTVTMALLLVVVGLLTGTLAGLLGIGGGVIMVPAMIVILGMVPVVAKGTSVAVIVPRRSWARSATERSRTPTSESLPWSVGSAPSARSSAARSPTG